MAPTKFKLIALTALTLLGACAEQAATQPPPFQGQGQAQYQVPLPDFIQQVEQQAIGEGVSPAVAHEALDTFTPDPRVVQLDRKQPETTITFAAYRQRNVTDARIARGSDLMHRYGDILRAIEARTGVPPQIIVALWGMESSFGQNMGSFETVNALASLAYEGRRAAFFRGELMAALHILDQEHMPSASLRGSWAGAMGQCQFMPTTYLKYAVDGDGDGRRDIWNNPVDTLASIANYLAAEGWQRDQSWGREVRVTAPLDPNYLGMNQALPLQQWAQLGVTDLDGLPLPASGRPASLVQPDGPGGDSFLLFDNARALMRWNHSTYFVVSVGLLADGIRNY